MIHMLLWLVALLAAATGALMLLRNGMDAIDEYMVFKRPSWEETIKAVAGLSIFVTAIRLLCAALVAATVLAPSPAFARQKTAALITGIFGTFLAPMNKVEQRLKARGYKVVRGTWLYTPPGRYDIAISHSAGTPQAYATGAKKIVTIDPTITAAVFQACPAGATCVNHHSWMSAVPLIVCCGGYPIRGARNIQEAGAPFVIFEPSHASMPDRIAHKVVP